MVLHGVVDRRRKLKFVNTGQSNCMAIEMIDLDLNILNEFSVYV